MRAGIVAAAIINFSMGHPDKPITEMDFVPAWLKLEDKPESELDLTTMSAEKQTAAVLNTMSKRTYTKR